MASFGFLELTKKVILKSISEAQVKLQNHQTSHDNHIYVSLKNNNVYNTDINITSCEHS